MNIDYIEKNIWQSKIESEASLWASQYKTGLDKLFSIMNNTLFDCSATSLEKSLSYNFCIQQLEKYLKHPEYNFILSQKYFQYLFEYKDDLVIDKIIPYFYKILICYFVKARASNCQLQKTVFELLTYLISQIDKLYSTSKIKYKASCKSLCDGLIGMFSMVDLGELSKDAYEFECSIFDVILNLLFQLSNLNGIQCKRNLINNFLIPDACAFYLDKNDKLDIKSNFNKMNETNNLVGDEKRNSYYEYLFRYAMAMKNKKYYNKELEKFKNNYDVLNSVLWSNKYLKDVIKTCINVYFKKKNGF